MLNIVFFPKNTNGNLKKKNIFGNFLRKIVKSLAIILAFKSQFSGGSALHCSRVMPGHIDLISVISVADEIEANHCMTEGPYL